MEEIIEYVHPYLPPAHYNNNTKLPVKPWYELYISDNAAFPVAAQGVDPKQPISDSHQGYHSQVPQDDKKEESAFKQVKKHLVMAIHPGSEQGVSKMPISQCPLPGT